MQRYKRQNKTECPTCKEKFVTVDRRRKYCSEICYRRAWDIKGDNIWDLSRTETQHTLYGTWRGMFDRCYNRHSKAYKYYGAKGVTICKRWFDFKFFIIDMGLKPKDKDSIDRKNPYGNYEPTNCRWATYKEQANNKRYKPPVASTNRYQRMKEIRTRLLAEL